MWILIQGEFRRLCRELTLTAVEELTLREVSRLYWSRKRGAWAVGIASVVVGSLVTAGSIILAEMSVMLAAVQGAVATIATLIVLSSWLNLRPMQSVYRAVNDLGYGELCERCGYRLDTLADDEPRCPECGAMCERLREDAVTGSNTEIDVEERRH